MTWQLQNLVDIPNLQMLMNRFHAATGIPVGILASDGEILVATGWQDICTKFHRIHPVTAARCRQSDAYINTHLSTQDYVQYKCRNGLWDLAVPIIIADEHVATLFMGQLFYDDEEIHEEFYRQQAREFGFDVDNYLEALRRVPIYSREKVRQIMAFYTTFVNFLVNTGLANYQRAEAEKALRVQFEQLFAIFDAIEAVLYVADMETHDLLYLNSYGEATFGKDWHGKKCYTVLQAKQSEPCAFCTNDRLVASGKPLPSHQWEYQNSKCERYYQCIDRAITWGDGRLVRLEIAFDITERKRMGEEIEILNTELAAHACELENANHELEAFNYSVSHDLRRHITIISGYSELVLELSADRLDEKTTGYLQQVNRFALQMGQLIETLLNFSLLTRSAMARTTVDLTTIARELLASLQASEPDRAVVCTIADGLSAEGDPKLLEIVLENLLGNAWKYTGVRETAQIEFGASLDGAETVFFVRDNGAGFDMAHAAKLFRPFERLPGTGEIPGHGIGLATVQRIIQRHGGRVWAEASTDHGATFCFTL